MFTGFNFSKTPEIYTAPISETSFSGDMGVIPDLKKKKKKKDYHSFDSTGTLRFTDMIKILSTRLPSML